MSKNRSILLIVEGERTEPKLVERVLEVYGIKDVEGGLSVRDEHLRSLASDV